MHDNRSNRQRRSQSLLQKAADFSKRGSRLVEQLEERVLFSEGASAQLSLVSQAGSGANTVYTYDVSLKDTGTTKVGTFWMSWVPGEDFLPTTPISETSPTGWGPPAIIGSGDSSDGASIQWVAQAAGDDLASGATLDGFGFSTKDSPSQLAGDAPAHPGTPVLTSFIYMGGPLTDAGFQFAVTPAVVNPTVTTTTAVVSSSGTITSGDSETFTATVTPTTAGATPTGTVTFTSNGTTIGTEPLQGDGTASLSTADLSEGFDSIVASYTGDSTYSASTSPAITETVNPVATGSGATTTSLVTSATTINTGAAVTFTATVAPTISGPAPTGTVNFVDGVTLLGSAAVQSDGTAAFPTSSLTAGAHSITAIYAGDANYSSSTSLAVAETVQTVVLSPTIAKSTLPAAVIAGQPAHGVVTVNVANQTNAVVKGAVTINIYATSDGLIDDTATLVGTVLHRVNLKGGKSTPVQVHIKSIPSGLAAGAYTLLARSTDPSSNIADSTTGPALQVEAPVISLSESFVRMTLPASVVAPGKSHATAIVNITNGGNITSSGATTVGIYLSTTGVVDGNAVLITSITRPLHIHAGKSSRVSVALHLIPTAPAGTYFVVAQVIDPQQQTSSVATASTISVTN